MEPQKYEITVQCPNCRGGLRNNLVIDNENPDVACAVCNTGYTDEKTAAERMTRKQELTEQAA